MRDIRRMINILMSDFTQARKIIMKGVFFGRLFSFFEKFGFHVLPSHYYSPIPDTRQLRKKRNQWDKEGSFAEVDFSLQEQIKLMECLRVYKNEYDNLPGYEEVLRKNFGEGFGPVECCILHAVIRHFKPRVIVEIGSGISTIFSANALSVNKKNTGIDSKVFCIELCPRQALNKIRYSCPIPIDIITKPVQDINIDFFQILGEGDVLFIDSSHIVKLNSDVNYLYLEVLPTLKKGVIIHIHDIAFPYPCPDPDYWVFRKHQFWTEAALVQAFLMYNSVFKMLLCSSFLHYKMPEVLSSVFSRYDYKKHLPASLWLQKVR